MKVRSVPAPPLPALLSARVVQSIRDAGIMRRQVADHDISEALVCMPDEKGLCLTFSIYSWNLKHLSDLQTNLESKLRIHESCAVRP